MTVDHELLAIERALWTGGADVYLRNLDDDCLVAFSEMGGVSTRQQIAASVDNGEGGRWREVLIELEGLLQPRRDVALLTYRASAVRGEHERYQARVSSGYVRREDGWKMMFHQQTPLVPA